MTLSHNLRHAFLLLIALLLTSGCDPETDHQPVHEPVQETSPELKPENPVETTPSVSDSNSRQPGDPLPTISSASQPDDGYQELQWEDLMPAGFSPESIVEKYEKELEQLAQMDDADPRVMELYGKIQAEMDNAPVNDALNGKKVKLPGFIAPLENNEDKVTEFLLVPYYGACIHVPPPPINQTVMVKTSAGNGISSDESYLPYWIKGVITTDGESTDIGSAGYRIEQAITEEFSE